MGKIIFRIPGEPEIVLDSDKMMEMAQLYRDLAEAFAEDMESIDSQQLRTVSDPRPSRADEPNAAKSETPVPASSGREKGGKK